MAKSKGRPKKAPERVLSERLELRLTVGERKAYEQASSKARLSISEWIRDVLSKSTWRNGKGS